MPLEATFHQLLTQCQKQRDDFQELQITVSEDRPLHGVVSLVDKLGESIEDALADAEAALQAAQIGEQAVRQKIDWHRVVRALTDCQSAIDRLQQRCYSNLICYDVMDEIVSLGRKRGGEWQVWTDLVREMLESCRQQLFETHRSLFQCWQEVMERMIPPASGTEKTAKTPKTAKEVASIIDFKLRDCSVTGNEPEIEEEENGA